MSTWNLKPDYNFKYFLLMMQSVLSGRKVPLPSEAVNWQVIYDIAVDHSLAGMLYFAIEAMPEEHRPQGDFMPYLKQMYQEQLVADLNLSIETDRILQLLSSEGIKCMPVKGIVTKYNYPQPHLRSMTDVDILCEEKSRLKVEDVFISDGYEKEHVGEKDISYRKNEILHFEMHNTLITEDSPAYSYFTKVWDRAVFRDNSLIADMTLEDTYIYMLEHLAKHIEGAGAGVRMYMDVYAFLKKYNDELDRDYIDKILSRILLSDFEKTTLGICRNWFSGEEDIDINSENAEFILNSCTFGRTKVAFMSETIKNYSGTTAAQNGMKRIFKKLFPSVKWMRLRFRAVDKLPVLYPFFVPAYWIDRAFISRNVKTSNLGNYFATDNSAEADAVKRYFASLGLEKRF